MCYGILGLLLKKIKRLMLLTWLFINRHQALCYGAYSIGGAGRRRKYQITVAFTISCWLLLLFFCCLMLPSIYIQFEPKKIETVKKLFGINFSSLSLLKDHIRFSGT